MLGIIVILFVVSFLNECFCNFEISSFCCVSTTDIFNQNLELINEDNAGNKEEIK